MSTFGRTTLPGLTNPGADAKNNIVATTFALSENGTVTSMSGYFNGVGSSTVNTWRGVIYPVNGLGSPNGLACIAATVPAVAPASIDGWTTAAFASGVPLAAGSYSLGAWFQTNADVALMYDAAVGSYDFDNSATYDPVALPHNFTDASTGPGTWALYATYTPTTSGFDLDAAGATGAGYVLTRYIHLIPFNVTEYVSEYTKIITPPVGPPFVFGAKGTSDISQAIADAQALASLNARRRHRYTGSPTGSTLTPTLGGDLLVLDQT